MGQSRIIQIPPGEHDPDHAEKIRSCREGHAEQIMQIRDLSVPYYGTVSRSSDLAHVHEIVIKLRQILVPANSAKGDRRHDDR